MALDLSAFAEMVAKKRGASGLRSTAQEIGISAATLSRIENGQLPDLTTFADVCAWLGEDPSRFLGISEKEQKSEPTVRVHLRKQATSSVETANALAQMILAAQQQLREMDNI